MTEPLPRSAADQEVERSGESGCKGEAWVASEPGGKSGGGIHGVSSGGREGQQVGAVTAGAMGSGRLENGGALVAGSTGGRFRGGGVG